MITKSNYLVGTCFDFTFPKSNRIHWSHFVSFVVKSVGKYLLLLLLVVAKSNSINFGITYRGKCNTCKNKLSYRELDSVYTNVKNSTKDLYSIPKSRNIVYLSKYFCKDTTNKDQIIV